MRKTPALKSVKSLLSNLNDQLCFSLFSENELVEKLQHFSGATNSLFTTDIFAKNPYANRIHISIGKIPDFQDRGRTFTLGSYFSTAYEVCASYYADAINILKNINSSSFQKVNKDQPEETFVETLRASGCNPPAQQIIDTLTYCRLRRNHFIHRNQIIKTHFASFISNNGINLNQYWGSRRGAVDFSKQNIRSFDPQETIDLIKLLRISVQDLDSALINSLNPDDILNKIATDKVESNPNNANLMHKRVIMRKVKSIAIREYGLTPIDSDISKAVDYAIANK